MEFGDRLRDARNKRGMTGERLGERLGVSKQTIAHWEANRYEPKLVYLSKLCDELRVSADWLLLEKTIEGLSPSAVEQGRFYDSLSEEEQRRWEAAKMLVREGAREEKTKQRTPMAVAPHQDMGEGLNAGEITVGKRLQADTLITGERHRAFKFRKPTKSSQSDQANRNPKSEPLERSQHAEGAPKTRRGGKS